METAAVLPALVVVLGAALWAVAIVGARLECVDAARAAARAAARGEPVDLVRRVALAAAPREARIVIERREDFTRVEITAEVRPGWGGRFPAVTVRATAVSAGEPGFPGSVPAESSAFRATRTARPRAGTAGRRPSGGWG